ncbi:hypothetical protein SAMN05444365_105134 [Micromonospora pattaloongensis]|uniref:Uncharacterized protein n=1 Tax=Micromonospora pattaloongensis TaxID=405436 RepID=A0A1H3PZS1_9ACTN|nr:hypothetical protein [Micromonospora pattaloongensis]SDZ06566.1 hypothetical protein SAMN05444365_105134 [Micromonospora pattaloongensis]
MVYVRLAAEWTDAQGTTYAAGDMVDVDAATLAELESTGVVRGDGEAGDAWAGPTVDKQAWAGPTSPPATEKEAWAGPTSPPVTEKQAWAGPTTSKP